MQHNRTLKPLRLNALAELVNKLTKNSTNGLTKTFYSKMITLKDVDPNMIANNLTPQHVSAPGYLLADEIAERGITVERFAQLTGIDVESLRGIIDGQVPITPAHAMIFEAALGIRANIWLGLQADYDMQKERSNKSFVERLRSIRQIAAVL